VTTDPVELLTTTRSVRKRLDLARPVDRATVEDCLRIGFQAPNGSNLQLYDWVLVDQPDIRAAIAEIYRRGLADQLALSAASTDPSPYPDTDAQKRISASVSHLIEHLHEVPILVIPTVSGRLEDASIFEQASRWGSILPAVWNFMLALRTRGLGSAWTTLHLYREKEMAELLDIPYDEVTQAGLFPVAYTLGTTFKPANRSLSEQHVHWNHW
jgi:nitroreductase